MAERAVIHQKIFLASMFLTVIALPLSRALLSVSLILLIVNWMVEGEFRRKWLILKKRPIIFFFMGFYLIHLFGLLYTDNPAAALKSLQVKLPLLFFPLVIGSESRLSRKEFHLVIRGFITSGLMASLLCLLMALRESYLAGASLLDYEYYTYYNFSSLISLHPTYFALFLNLSLFGIVWLWYDRRKRGEEIHKGRLVWQGMVLLGVLLLLSARMQIIILLLVTVLSVIWFSARRGKIWQGAFVVMGLTAVLSAGILFNPENYRRFEDLFSASAESRGIENSGKGVRVFIWDNAVSLMRENLWIGVGTGDSLDELAESYRSDGFEYGFESRLNAHNQYLETGVALGLVGMVYLLVGFLLPAGWAIRRRNYLYLGFLILFALSCLTESMLSRQHGVNFYAFFNAFLAFQFPFLRNTNSG